MSEFINSLDRKAMMYEMLLAIENDFIENLEKGWLIYESTFGNT